MPFGRLFSILDLVLKIWRNFKKCLQCFLINKLHKFFIEHSFLYLVLQGWIWFSIQIVCYDEKSQLKYNPESLLRAAWKNSQLWSGVSCSCQMESCNQIASWGTSGFFKLHWDIYPFTTQRLLIAGFCKIWSISSYMQAWLNGYFYPRSRRKESN